MHKQNVFLRNLRKYFWLVRDFRQVAAALWFSESFLVRNYKIMISITQIACMGLYFVIQQQNSYGKWFCTKSEKIFLTGSKFPSTCCNIMIFRKISCQKLRNHDFEITIAYIFKWGCMCGFLYAYFTSCFLSFSIVNVSMQFTSTFNKKK